MASVQYEVAVFTQPPKLTTDRPTSAPPVDCALTQAEYNLLRRLRQIRRCRIAKEVILDVPTMTLRLVSVDTERLDTNT